MKMTSTETKELIAAYRQRATEIYQQKVGNLEVRIDERSTVWLTEDGAFVEAQVWVPAESLAK